MSEGEWEDVEEEPLSTEIETDLLDTEPSPDQYAEEFLRLIESNKKEKADEALRFQAQIDGVLSGRETAPELSSLEKYADTFAVAGAVAEMRDMLSKAQAERAAAIEARDTLAHAGGELTIEPPLDTARLDGATFDRLVRELTGHVDPLAAAPAGFTPESWAKALGRPS